MIDKQLDAAENIIKEMTEIQRKAVMKYAITLAYLAVADFAASDDVITPEEYDISYLLEQCDEPWGKSLI